MDSNEKAKVEGEEATAVTRENLRASKSRASIISSYKPKKNSIAVGKRDIYI